MYLLFSNGEFKQFLSVCFECIKSQSLEAKTTICAFFTWTLVQFAGGGGCGLNAGKVVEDGGGRMKQVAGHKQGVLMYHTLS